MDQALAISGGVDSMALAYLCTKIQKQAFWAVVVDHRMRAGSAIEAANVVEELKRIGIRGEARHIQWPKEVENPNDLPNVETWARHYRYRKIGNFCQTMGCPTLFTAHHEDDQYETVLMRLLSGHGYRGLRGMRPATDIPECYDLHGVYQSGIIDDQMSGNPDYDWIAGANKPTPPLGHMDIEEGGVMIYRPMLQFSKDRLVATCVENGVKWFEDHTNTDQTLTLRNAVRHMYKNHKLPVALQKPAILRLSEQCRDRVAKEEAEADRFLKTIRIDAFEPNVGTMAVNLPPFILPRVSRMSLRSPESRQRRINYYRLIAALVLRRLLSMVTPERELPQLGQLDHLVSLLFPSLAGESSLEPKAYVICGVHFIPLVGEKRLRWLLTRAPYLSNVPRPCAKFAGLHFHKWAHLPPERWKTEGWTRLMQLYDGRYWVRLIHRLPCRINIAPFEKEHQKPFRDSLVDGKTRNDLAAMLKRYAPGKIRYTLPAIYAAQDITRLLTDNEWWPPMEPEEEDLKSEHPSRAERKAREFAIRDEFEKKMAETENLHLVALPTLGIQVGGLENWLRWEVRYRKVDEDVLQLSRCGGARLFRRELKAKMVISCARKLIIRRRLERPTQLRRRVETQEVASVVVAG